jgi:hypothetical protein
MSIKEILNCEDGSPRAYSGILAAMLGEAAIAEQFIQQMEKAYGSAPSFFDFDTADIAVLLPDKTTAKRLLRKFEAKGSRGAALYIALEIAETGTVVRLLEYISKYGLRAPNRGYLFLAVDALMKAVCNNPELGKRVVKKVEHERGVEYIEGDIEYLACAGRIAAILGAKTYAKRAITLCVDNERYLEAGAIAALLGEVTATETLISKAYSNRKNSNKLFPQVGYILAFLALHDPQAAQRIFHTIEKQDNESLDALAAKILATLLYFSSPLRQEQNASTSSSTDPLNQLTQSMRSLSENVERLKVATEKCIRVIDDNLG